MKNKVGFKVEAVKLESRFEQQSALAGAIAIIGAMSATSAYAEDNCGTLQDSPCKACCTIDWPF